MLSHKAFLINSVTKTFDEIEIPSRRTGQQLPAMQRLVGGHIEVAHRFDNRDVVLVDEESMLKQLEYGFCINGGHQPFYGNGLVCRMGDTSVASTREFLGSVITFWVKIKNGAHHE